MNRKLLSAIRLPGVVLFASLSMPVAFGAEPIDFNIPSQPLSSAITILTEQAGIQALYSEGELGEIQSPELKGSFTAEEAIKLILEGTDLTYEFTNADTVVVRKKVGTASGSHGAMPTEMGRTHGNLPLMVVTATRGEIDIKDSPAAVNVVTSEDLEKRNAMTLDQAVNNVPGVFAKRGKGLMDTLSDIYMRGMPTQSRNLIMLDGVPLNNSSNHRVNLTAIDLENIQRIEVVRGPFSSLYGGNAMGGVINIISAPITENDADMSIGYGDSFSDGEAQDDLVQGSIKGSLKATERIGVRAGYMYRRTDGYPAGYVFRATPPPAGLTGSTQGVDRTGVSRYLIGHTGDNYFQDDTLMMGGNYILSDTSDLRLNIYRNEREYKFENPRSYLRDTAGSEVFVTATGTTPSPTPTPNFLSGSGPGGLEETNYIFHYTDQYWGGVNSHLTLGFHDEPDNWFVSPGATAATTINGGPGTISNTEGEHRTLDWQFESLLGDHLLTTGFSLRQGEIHRTVYSLADWKDRDNTGVKTNDDVGKDRIFALYLQDRFNISDNVTAHIGMRNDWWKGYDGRTVLAANPDPIIYANRNQNTFSPKAVLVYKPSPVTSYRLGAGKAFRSPSLSDLYQTTQTTNTLTTSNPNLKPETTISWELGLDHTFMSGINLAATYFDNEMDDFIYRLDTGTVDSSGRAIATRANAAKAYSRGVELGLNGEVAMVNWYANYTYTKAKITENPAVPDSEGKFLQQIPEHMANIGADWKRNRLTLSGAVRYADDRWGTDQNLETVFDTYGAYGSYTLVEAKIAYQLTDRLKASLSLDNITDEEWFDFFPAPGRSWFAEISADLF